MRALVLLSALALAPLGLAQERMTQDALHKIIREVAPQARAEGNVIVFRVAEVELVGVSDPAADRMRIMAPIKRLADSSAEELYAAMQANFHTVLDARYAISNGVIYAAYLHPLSSLTREQVISAMRQVASAYATFGSSYSGGGPAFPGR